ncbi:MAG: hypothetical protein QM820_24770 [Minicystis sp.]
MTQTNLLRLADAPRSPADRPDWQRLWLAIQRTPWRSLAVIPAHHDIPTTRVARAITQVATRHLGPTALVGDATAITLDRLQAAVSCWIARPEGDPRVVLALAPVLTSPASLALAQAADAAILCLSLGRTALADAARTVEEVGRSRLLGAVILKEGDLR